MTWGRIIRVGGAYAGFMLLSLPVGTAWHELMGHGFVGVLCGGRIGSVEVLGMEVWPGLSWRGWPEVYGTCQVEDVPTAFGEGASPESGAGLGAALEGPVAGPDLPWNSVAGVVQLELRAVGVNAEQTMLSPGAIYEIHYVGAAHPVEGYTLRAAATGGGCPAELVEPAAEGEWADTGLFEYGGATQVGSVPENEIRCETPGYSYYVLMDDMIEGDLASGESGYLGDIQVGETRELEFHLLLYFADEMERTTYQSEGLRSYAVFPLGPDFEP